MKAKISRGGGFRGALNYVFDTKQENQISKNPEIVGGNMSMRGASGLAKEFAVARQLRPDISRPVWHCSLSLPAGDRLSSEKWEQVAADFMQEVGFSDANQFVAVRHSDTDHDHIHIVASRVGLDGKVWHGKWEARTAIEATQRLEQKHGLTLTPGLGEARAEKRQLTDNEINMGIRTGEKPSRLVIQESIDSALDDTRFKLGNRHPDTFAQMLANEYSVNATPAYASTGKLNGFTFEFEGIRFKGSDLGKNYSLNGLIKRGIHYDSQQQQIKRNEILAEQLRNKAGIGQPEQSHGEPSPSLGANGSINGELERRSPTDNVGIQVEDGKLTEKREVQHREPAEVGGGIGETSQERLGKTPDADGQNRQQSRESDQRSEHESRESRSTFDDLDSVLVGVDLNHNSALGRLFALAASTENRNPTRGKQVPGGAQLPADSRAKLKAMQAQLDALNAPAYRLTLKDRRPDIQEHETGQPATIEARSYNMGKNRGPDGEEKFYTAAEVMDLMPKLRRENARGFDIYITPIDEENNYILVDDMKQERTMQDLKLNPTVVQKSSEGNWQAIFKTPKAEKLNKEVSNTLTSVLNQKYGDKKLSGAIHPFRLAGFSNKKPERGNAITTLVVTNPTPCPNIAKMLNSAVNIEENNRRKLREFAEAQRQRQEAEQAERQRQAAFNQRVNGVKNAPVVGITDAEQYAKIAKSIIGNTPIDKVDWSKVDFGVAKEICKHTLANEKRAFHVIMAGSPNIHTRHENTTDYLNRTIQNATQQIESDRKIAREQSRNQSQSRGMEM